jgi:hypothetical protein
MYNLLKEVIKLDIYDLNFAYSSKELNLLSSNAARLPRRGILIRIFSFMWHFLQSAKGLKSAKLKSQLHPGSILFFSSSKNQFDSLEPLLSKMDNAFILCGGSEENLACAQNFPVIFSYFLSLFFFPIILPKFFASKGYRRETFYYIFDRYWLTYGYYILSWFKLNQLSPKALVVSNDHNMSNRVITDVANKQGVPTFYIQHASVTDNFPPLSFDYALLEGVDALKKYECAGSSESIVFLVGMPKADAYSQYHNNKPYVRSLGICVNMLDPVHQINRLCEQLRREFPGLNIYLRPHPGDKRTNLWNTISEKFKLSLSNSKLESSFDFLRKVDAILAGDSNIILEAALMNIYPIYYDFAQTELDWYGFQRNGLVNYYRNPEDVGFEIHRLLRFKPPIREKASIYCSTIGTIYDGRSTELACNLIKQLTDGEELDENDWVRVPESRLVAYQLNSAISGIELD